MQKSRISLKNIFERKDTSGLSIFARGHHFDWKVLLASFFLLIIGVLLFSVHVFLGVRAGDIFQADSSSVAPTALINRKGLDNVINDFVARADRLKVLQAGKPVLVDPSR